MARTTNSTRISPIFLLRTILFTIFSVSLYYLVGRWSKIIQSILPVIDISYAELAATIVLFGSTMYLLRCITGKLKEIVRSHFFRSTSEVVVAEGVDCALPPVPLTQPDHASLASQPEDIVAHASSPLRLAEVDHASPSPTQQADVGASSPLRPAVIDHASPQPTAEVDHASPQPAADVDHTSVDAEHASSPSRPASDLKDEMEIVAKIVSGATPSYLLESNLGDCRKAAKVRRHAVEILSAMSLDGLPLDGFDYNSIFGQCCEMPVGYIQIPVGIAGPLLIDGKQFMLPMATTEGCLVASTNRGCKAIALSGGASAIVLHDGMSRAPVVRFDTVKRAAELKLYLEDPENFNSVAEIFNSSSRFARLQKVYCMLAGRNLYMRFTCSTGDAMGMNMVSKGVQNVLEFLRTMFLDMEIISISGNFCADKKAAAVNTIMGRGKSVVCEAVIKGEVVTKVLRTTVSALVELNTVKNLAGSAVAGAGSGGFNAHASNIVTAIFIATGQDPAQNVESSNCLTMFEAVNDGKDLHISVTMNSIEVGTIGGGTQLASQSACLNLLGVKGANTSSPGENSRKLATIISGAVLAGELFLMTALATGQLVKSHMKYNRSNKEGCQ